MHSFSIIAVANRLNNCFQQCVKLPLILIPAFIWRQSVRSLISRSRNWRKKPSSCLQIPPGVMKNASQVDRFQNNKNSRMSWMSREFKWDRDQYSHMFRVKIPFGRGEFEDDKTSLSRGEFDDRWRYQISRCQWHGIPEKTRHNTLTHILIWFTDFWTWRNAGENRAER
jgi:hypothetical protein